MELLYLCFRAHLQDKCFQRAARQRWQSNLGGKGAQEPYSLELLLQAGPAWRSGAGCSGLASCWGSFSVCPVGTSLVLLFVFVLLLCAARSSLAFAFWWPPYRCAGTAVRPSQTYLCSRLSQPCSLSLSPQDRCSIPSCLGDFFAELTLVFQCPPRTGRAKTGCSISLWSKGCCPMANDHFPWLIGWVCVNIIQGAGGPLLLGHAVGSYLACSLIWVPGPWQQRGLCCCKGFSFQGTRLHCPRFLLAHSSSPSRTLPKAALHLSIRTGPSSLKSYENLMSVHLWSMLRYTLFTVWWPGEALMPSLRHPLHVHHILCLCPFLPLLSLTWRACVTLSICFRNVNQVK